MSRSEHNAGRIEEAEKLIEALEQAEVYDHAAPDIRIVETHLSWIVLTGQYAYKLKKPVALPFVDFSTLERRRKACETEVDVNRRLAPELYIGVVAIGGPREAPMLHKEPAIEYAVKMREFPPDARLDKRVDANAIDAAKLEPFAERIAAFHERAAGNLDQEVAAAHDPNAAFAANLAELRDELEAEGKPQHGPRTEPASEPGAGAEPKPGAGTDPQPASGPQAEPGRVRLTALASVADWHAREAPRLGQLFTRRLAGGFVREVHGDLHLENLVLIDDEIVAFDALEFDKALRSIDVIDEAAGLVMDLVTRRRADLGFAFLSRYLQVTGDYEGLPALRFYLAHRALVRAKVKAIAAHQHDTASAAVGLDYTAEAARLIAPAAPRLIVMHGLSASGKSSVAAALVGRLGGIAIRSDLERKRLFGLDERAASGSGVGAGIYDEKAGERTYAALEQHASHALEARVDTIIDAACLERSARDRFRRLAQRHGMGFVLLDCAAPREELERRIVERARRRSDASEATLAVLDRQIRTQDPLGADERETAVVVDTSTALDVAALARSIDALSS